MAQPSQHQDRQPGIESEMTPRPEYTPFYPGGGKLKDKVALITGGDSGIGRAVAVLYAREGANIAIAYKDEDGDAKETQRLIEAEGSTALLFKADVGRKADCEAFVAKAEETFGRIDILVNNAAEQHVRDDFAAVEEAEIRSVFDTNIFGYIFMAQAVLPHLKQGGRIINSASIVAYRGHPELVDYATTKGAISAFTRSLAVRLADKGILVNAVAPGPIWTPLIPASFDAEDVGTFGDSTPLGRAGQPNEVAPAYLFLATEDSRYITGQAIHVNGGDFPSS